MIKVREGQTELEERVFVRTSHLEAANKQLELLSESDLLKRSEAEKERAEALEALRVTER